MFASMITSTVRSATSRVKNLAYICWARDMVNLMMMIRSFLANIVCVFSYFEEVLKDFCIKSSWLIPGMYD